jgi:hypothetical protein
MKFSTKKMFRSIDRHGVKKKELPDHPKLRVLKNKQELFPFLTFAQFPCCTKQEKPTADLPPFSFLFLKHPPVQY